MVPFHRTGRPLARTRYRTQRQATLCRELAPRIYMTRELVFDDDNVLAGLCIDVPGGDSDTVGDRWENRHPARLRSSDQTREQRAQTLALSEKVRREDIRRRPFPPNTC